MHVQELLEEELQRIAASVEDCARRLIPVADSDAFVALRNDINLPALNNQQNGVSTAIAIGLNYTTAAHTDNGCFFSIVSAVPHVFIEATTEKVLYEFVFPQTQQIVPLKMRQHLCV